MESVLVAVKEALGIIPEPGTRERCESMTPADAVRLYPEMEPSCAICLESYRDTPEQLVVVLKHAKIPHVMHKVCLETYRASALDPRCPVCRADTACHRDFWADALDSNDNWAGDRDLMLLNDEWNAHYEAELAMDDEYEAELAREYLHSDHYDDYIPPTVFRYPVTPEQRLYIFPERIETLEQIALIPNLLEMLDALNEFQDVFRYVQAHDDDPRHMLDFCVEAERQYVLNIHNSLA